MKNFRLVLLLLLALVVFATPATNDLASLLGTPDLVTGQTVLVTGQANRVGTVTVRDLLTPISSISQQVVMPAPYPQGAQAFAEGKNETEQPGFVPPGESSKIITSPSATSQASTTTVNLVLSGVSGSSPNPCGCTPPDTNDAVGPKHVFETVNLAGLIYFKNGTVAKSTFSLSTFFQLSGQISDPQILYDPIGGRWFSSIADVTNGNVRVAVSTTNDPTGTWNLYSFSAGGFLPDQPYIGTSDDKFGITANDFTRTGAFVGAQYWIVNKSELDAGSSAIDFSTTNPDSSMHTLRPVRHLTTTSPFYFVTNCIGTCVTDTMLSTTNTVQLLTASGLPPGPVSVNAQTFSVSTSVQPPNAQQPGCLRGTCELVTNDNSILSAVWESNKLWLAWADSCIPTSDSTNRSCLHLVQASITGTGTATKNQDFDYASKGEYLFYPSISLYQGQLVVVYGKSSANSFPSLFAAGRLASDPANTLETAAAIAIGTSDDLSMRYGDYFGASTDPLPTDNSTFWVSGEYRTSSANTAWNTAVAQVGSFAPDFTISATPSNITMNSGSLGNLTLAITGYKFAGNINLGATIAPAGLSCTLNPTTVTLGASATSKLSCRGPQGTYNVTVSATTGSLSRSVSIPVTVQPLQIVGGQLMPIGRDSLFLSYIGPGFLGLTMTLLLTTLWRTRSKRMQPT